MPQEFNLTAVYVSNILGITLIGVLLVCNLWRLRDKKKESRYLLWMMFFICSSCIVDPIVYTVDGTPGILNKFVIFWGNSWLYLSNVLVGACWVCFFSHYSNGGMSKKQSVFVLSTIAVAAVILAVNIFKPIAFEVNEANVYTRKGFFFVFLVLNYMLLFEVIDVYVKTLRRGIFVKFMPVWIFMLPTFVGAAVQSLFYGVSVIAPSLAISVTGALASLQNDSIFMDGLTGLRNRHFLDRILRRISKRRNATVTGIMLDLNGFKGINDKFGHAVGDTALVYTAEILREVVGDLGVVIRYAGDEFVIILNTHDDSVIESTVQGIRDGFRNFNLSRNVPYRLSASIGYRKQDSDNFNDDAFIRAIDEKMYEDKKVYYETNGENDRRHR